MKLRLLGGSEFGKIGIKMENTNYQEKSGAFWLDGCKFWQVVASDMSGGKKVTDFVEMILY